MIESLIHTGIVPRGVTNLEESVVAGVNVRLLCSTLALVGGAVFMGTNLCYKVSLSITHIAHGHNVMHFVVYLVTGVTQLLPATKTARKVTN